MPCFINKHAYKPVKFFLEKYFASKLFFELIAPQGGGRSVPPAFLCGEHGWQCRKNARQQKLHCFGFAHQACLKIFRPTAQPLAIPGEAAPGCPFSSAFIFARQMRGGAGGVFDALTGGGRYGFGRKWKTGRNFSFQVLGVLPFTCVFTMSAPSGLRGLTSCLPFVWQCRFADVILSAVCKCSGAWQSLAWAPVAGAPWRMVCL